MDTHGSVQAFVNSSLYIDISTGEFFTPSEPITDGDALRMIPRTIEWVPGRISQHPCEAIYQLRRKMGDPPSVAVMEALKAMVDSTEKP